MSNPEEPLATRRNSVTAAIEAFGTLPLEQRVTALAAALIEAGTLTEQDVRTAVFRVSGIPMA